ncbi:MAG TPA: tetratricopeptide repeat protein [Gemmataceae bacterium]|nr:tetratricopeptide repeat protein [Gemmataceae bacterium]
MSTSPQNERPELPQVPGYEIRDVLGRGGMGVVFRAYDAIFDRPLAIKVLTSIRGAQAENEKRFLEEARITGQLQHPGIPPAHEMGRLKDGRPFFSMKLIEGRTLHELLGKRLTPQTELPRFLKIFEQIAQTLAYVHNQGVIHRDLKPSNIMVGPFGEVQVMDWGLAKRMYAEKWAGREAPKSTPVAAAAETIASPDSGYGSLPPQNPGPVTQHLEKTVVTTPRPDFDRLTQTGQALGTPAFMAPEQARGEIDILDERTDVFGLGAILCVILTGAPPYRGVDQESNVRRAANAELGDAYQRLRLSLADAELIDLCCQCLQAEAEKRPAHAGVVADQISRYLASVQEQLEQARVARATAELQAGEERKRRRLAIGLAISVAMVILVSCAMGLWYVREQAKRDTEAAIRRSYLEREVSNALNEGEQRRRELHERLRDERKAAELLSNPREWQRLVDSAQESLRRAGVLAADSQDNLSVDLRQRLVKLAEELTTDEKERRLAAELDRIRLELTEVQQGQVRIQPVGPKMAQAFRAAGYDIVQGNPPDLALQIRQSPIRLALVGALDFWAQSATEQELQARLLEVARRADPDPWRDRFRQPDVWDARARLQQLANQVDCAHHSPQVLTALGDRLRSRNGDALALFRRALLAHPADFWLYVEFGMTSKNPVEQAGAFRAALSIRPDSPILHYNLGVVLQAQRYWEEAAACYRQAIELDPQSGGAHNNLGLVLEEQGHRVESMACYRRAIECDPRNATAYINLGGALKAEHQIDEAITWYRKALEIDPNHSAALNNLGGALIEQGKLEQGMSYLRQALASGPDNAMAWCNLGLALRKQWKFAEALIYFLRGHEIGSRDSAWAYPSAEWIASAERALGLEKRLAAVLGGGSPTGNAWEKLALAELCMARQKNHAVAVRCYVAAFTADSHLVDDISAGHRYRAARAAVQAAASAEVSSDLNETERERLRKQALGWLTSELKAWDARTEQQSIPRPVVTQLLHRWQNDAALTSVRDEAALSKLTVEEQSAWRRFWVDVARLASPQ